MSFLTSHFPRLPPPELVLDDLWKSARWAVFSSADRHCQASSYIYLCVIGFLFPRLSSYAEFQCRTDPGRFSFTQFGACAWQPWPSGDRTARTVNSQCAFKVRRVFCLCKSGDKSIISSGRFGAVGPSFCRVLAVTWESTHENFTAAITVLQGVAEP